MNTQFSMPEPVSGLYGPHYRAHKQTMRAQSARVTLWQILEELAVLGGLLLLWLIGG